jgi:exodeoxyribonuclease V beta subunit
MTSVNEGCVSLDDCMVASNIEVCIKEKEESPNRVGRSFTAKIDQRIGITSFSAITRGYSMGLKDSEEEDTVVEKADNVILEGRHALAKGAHIGTALHNVLEFTDFTRWAKGENDSNKELLTSLTRQELKANGVIINNEKLELALPEYSQWMTEVINTPFLNIQSSDCIALKDLTDWYPELTFTFSLNRKFSKTSLQAFLEKHGYSLTGLSGPSIYGMLTGAIDLIFSHEGKYYLADYKSNHLGNNYSAYTDDALKANNDKKAYTLQYLIYTVALHKHLSERIQNYDYETHFGGVLYLYIRGMHPEQKGKGVFFDLPDKSVIEALADYFSNSSKNSAETDSCEKEVAL